MEVRYEMDRVGGVEMTPIAAKWQQLIDAYCRHLSDAGCPEWSGSVYANAGAEADEALDDLGPRQRGDVEGGYAVIKRVDPWAWLHWVGYDAHTIAESPELEECLRKDELP